MKHAAHKKLIELNQSNQEEFSKKKIETKDNMLYLINMKYDTIQIVVFHR
jgi:hypothetical protein